MYTYYSLASLVKSNRPIDRALLKYGFSNFKLEILEYSDKKNVLIREQYYMDLLKPEYNIAEKAGSTLGYKHTPESLAKMRDFVLNDEVRARKAVATKNATAARRISVVVENIKTKSKQEFVSLTDAGFALGVSKAAISQAIINNRLIKKIYRLNANDLTEVKSKVFKYKALEPLSSSKLTIIKRDEDNLTEGNKLDTTVSIPKPNAKLSNLKKSKSQIKRGFHTYRSLRNNKDDYKSFLIIDLTNFNKLRLMGYIRSVELNIRIYNDYVFIKEFVALDVIPYEAPKLDFIFYNTVSKDFVLWQFILINDNLSPMTLVSNNINDYFLIALDSKPVYGNSLQLSKNNVQVLNWYYNNPYYLNILLYKIMDTILGINKLLVDYNIAFENNASTKSPDNNLHLVVYTATKSSKRFNIFLYIPIISLLIGYCIGHYIGVSPEDIPDIYIPSLDELSPTILEDLDEDLNNLPKDLPEKDNSLEPTVWEEPSVYETDKLKGNRNSKNLDWLETTNSYNLEQLFEENKRDEVDILQEQIRSLKLNLQKKEIEILQAQLEGIDQVSREQDHISRVQDNYSKLLDRYEEHLDEKKKLLSNRSEVLKILRDSSSDKKDS